MVFGYQSTRHPFHQLRNEVDRLLTGFFGPAADGFLPAVFRSQPAVNVWEQQDALKVEMELPGIKSEQLDISVAGDELSIKVNRPDVAQEGVTYHRRERPGGLVQPHCAAAGRSRRRPRRSRPPRRRADDHPAQGRERQAAEDQRHRNLITKGATAMENENTVVKTPAEQPALAERTRSGCCYRPNVDILEQNDELLVMADVPGAKSDTIDVKFEDGTLEIQAAVRPAAATTMRACCANTTWAITIGVFK